MIATRSSTMRHSLTRGLLVAGTVVGLIATSVSPSFAAANDSSSDTESSVDIPATTDLKTLLPPVPEDLMKWASDTQTQFENDPQFSTVRLSDDRKSAEIFWHGDVTPDLTEAVAMAPATYPIEVESTAYQPGELRQAAVALLEQGTLSGATVTATWANPDGSGLGVEVIRDSAARSSEAQSEQAAFSGFPVEIAEGENVGTVGRLDDNLHVGGSRLLKTTGGACSLGFAVQVPGEPGASGHGGMFASHCGNVGDSWVRPSSTSSVYAMGSTAVEVNDRDGAILRGTYFQPAVYIGSYQSSSYVSVTSVNNPVANTEICYSGSFSGTTCGNLVSVPIYNYTLAGVGSITGSVRRTRKVSRPQATATAADPASLWCVTPTDPSAFRHPSSSRLFPPTTRKRTARECRAAVPTTAQTRPIASAATSSPPRRPVTLRTTSVTRSGPSRHD